MNLEDHCCPNCLKKARTGIDSIEFTDEKSAVEKQIAIKPRSGER